MKLEYRMLWFEDDHESVQDVIYALRDLLREQGFNLVCKWGECNAAAMTGTVERLQKYNPYDLIVFDYDLGDGVKGETLARELRSKIWTEIVYYSANRTFDELASGMFEHKVEGVFCAIRQTLEESIWRIISSQIKRMCDLNNMRGIVLDSMSEIDAAIRYYLHKKCQTMAEFQKECLVSKIRQRVKKKAEETNAFGETLTPETLSQAVYNHHYIDFQTIRTRLKDDHPCFCEESPMKVLQTLRNKLAHQPSHFNDVENVMELIDQQANSRETMDYERFKNIRMQLLEVRKDLVSIGALQE